MSRTTFLIVLVLFVAMAAWFADERQHDQGSRTERGTESALVVADPAAANAQAPVMPGPIRGRSDQPCDEGRLLPLTELLGDPETEALFGQLELLGQGVSEELAVSTEAEHLLVAALREEDRPTRFRLLNRALSASPDSAVVLSTAMQSCFWMRAEVACPLDEWESRLLQLDSDNSEAWMMAAAFRFGAGKKAAALAALRQAATAPETRVYWPEIIEWTERSLSAVGNFSFAERVAIAFSTAASVSPNYQQYTSMCREQSAQDPEWASLCLAYGERAEAQSRTMLGAMIARAIQGIALEQLGEVQKLAEVNVRREQFRQQRQAAGESGQSSITDFVVMSPTLFSAYITVIKSEGEAEAEAYLASEVRRVLGGALAAGCTRE